jgi:rhodanese-related sulfurtransferase
MANAISPRGLSLTRNYFPGDTGVRTPIRQADLTKPNQASPSAAQGQDELIVKRLKDKGLKPLDLDQVLQLFHDPGYPQQLIVILDARDEAHYQKGHIPGALLFDHYRAERYLPKVLPVCQTADSIVVYCNGGDCEDSEFAATQLQELGIASTKLAVYLGGFSQWSSNNLPVELETQRDGESAHPNP